jgi:hypothetical protein
MFYSSWWMFDVPFVVGTLVFIFGFCYDEVRAEEGQASKMKIALKKSNNSFGASRKLGEILNLYRIEITKNGL